MMSCAKQRPSVTVVIVSVIAVVAWCAFIFAMSAMPADDSTELSMGVVWHIIGFIVPGYDQMSLAEQLQWQQMLDHPVRKTAHFLEYALLGALMVNLVFQVARYRDERELIRTSLSKLAVGAWVLATAYAVTDEVHQMFIPGRSCEVTDMLLDSVGVLVGVLIVALIIRVCRLAAKKPKQLL